MIELRNDDILQVNVYSAHHNYRLKKKTPWKWFLECDRVFEEYDFPQTLVILSEGIEHYSEWVEHIKKNIHRYKIELHGSSHYFYDTWTAKDAYEDLKKAKERIEKEFGVNITTWYVPYGKRHFPSWGKEVCAKLGLEFDITAGNKQQFLFHYWHQIQVDKAIKLVKNSCQNLATN